MYVDFFHLWFLVFIAGDLRVLFISCLAEEEEPFLEVLCGMLREPCWLLWLFECFLYSLNVSF